MEHANQEKKFYSQNNLEFFILRLSNFVKNNNSLYAINPEERFAEIKSYQEIILLVDNIKNKFEKLLQILQTDKLQKQLRGYVYYHPFVKSPLITFFEEGNKEYILN